VPEYLQDDILLDLTVNLMPNRQRRIIACSEFGFRMLEDYPAELAIDGTFQVGFT
jgi:hypothetical protein